MSIRLTHEKGSPVIFEPGQLKSASPNFHSGGSVIVLENNPKAIYVTESTEEIDRMIKSASAGQTGPIN